MANNDIVFISRLDLPDSKAGRSSTPKVTITSKGAFLLSNAAFKHLNGASHVAVGWTKGTRELSIYGANAAVVKAVQGGLKACQALRLPKEGKGSCSFGATAILNDEVTFGDDGLYDYRTSGNQIFDAECGGSEKTGWFLRFVLPAGALVPRPIVNRRSKPKNPVNGVTKPVIPLPVPDAEIELEMA